MQVHQARKCGHGRQDIEVNIDSRAARVSSPQKVYFAGLGFTKQLLPRRRHRHCWGIEIPAYHYGAPAWRRGWKPVEIAWRGNCLLLRAQSDDRAGLGCPGHAHLSCWADRGRGGPGDLATII